MKSIKMVLLGTIVLVSCSRIQSVPATTTTTTTTVVPIDYGTDCKRATLFQLNRLFDELKETEEKWNNVNKIINTFDDLTVAMMASAERSVAYVDFFVYLRALDIRPFSAEQRKVIDVTQDFLDENFRDKTPDGAEVSENEYIIPFFDATTDFFNAVRDVCDR